jgi:hypothetical protein
VQVVWQARDKDLWIQRFLQGVVIRRALLRKICGEVFLRIPLPLRPLDPQLLAAKALPYGVAPVHCLGETMDAGMPLRILAHHRGPPVGWHNPFERHAVLWLIKAPFTPGILLQERQGLDERLMQVIIGPKG